MLPSRVTLPLLALALLSACGDGKGDEPQRKTAAGEVLGGSISDAMLPLDTVRSQSPSLREGGSAEPASGEEEAGDTSAASPSPAPSSSATAEPAASPSGEDDADAED